MKVSKCFWAFVAFFMVTVGVVGCVSTGNVTGDSFDYKSKLWVTGGGKASGNTVTFPVIQSVPNFWDAGFILAMGADLKYGDKVTLIFDYAGSAKIGQLRVYDANDTSSNMSSSGEFPLLVGRNEKTVTIQKPGKGNLAFDLGWRNNTGQTAEIRIVDIVRDRPASVQAPPATNSHVKFWANPGKVLDTAGPKPAIQAESIPSVPSPWDAGIGFMGIAPGTRKVVVVFINDGPELTATFRIYDPENPSKNIARTKLVKIKPGQNRLEVTISSPRNYYTAGIIDLGRRANAGKPINFREMEVKELK